MCTAQPALSAFAAFAGAAASGASTTAPRRATWHVAAPGPAQATEAEPGHGSGQGSGTPGHVGHLDQTQKHTETDTWHANAYNTY